MTARVRPIPEGYHAVTPYLCVKGAASAIEFYKPGEGRGAADHEVGVGACHDDDNRGFWEGSLRRLDGVLDELKIPEKQGHTKR
jgi:hypothetical protein